MINQQLIDYIKLQTQHGVSSDAIKNALRSNGWVDADINQAFSSLTTPQGVTSPVAPVQTFTSNVSVTPHKKFTVVAIIVIALLVVAGLAYAIMFLVTTDPSPGITPINNFATSSLPVASSTSESSVASTSTVSASQTSQKPVTATQNCGSVDTTRMNSLNGVSAMNTQDKASLVCASKALASCSPATLTYSDTGTMLKIVGQNGLFCSMTMTNKSPPTYISCEVPMSLVSQVVQSAQKSQPGDLFSYSIVAAGLFFSGMPLTNTQTGEIVTVDCSSN